MGIRHSYSHIDVCSLLLVLDSLNVYFVSLFLHKATPMSALELGQKLPSITVTKQTVNKYLPIPHDLAAPGPNT